MKSGLIYYITICILISFTSCQKQENKTNLSIRRVENNNLISNSTPEKTFQVSNNLPFLADTSFTLSERADAEVFMFTSSKKGSVDRFLHFQFERLKPHIEGTYKDEIPDIINIGEINFGKSYWCTDITEAIEENPESDIAITQKLLNNAGANTFGKYAGLKLLYFSEDKRSELLIFYGEKITIRGIECDNEEIADTLLEQIYKEALTEFSIDANQ